jgi:hypothetical protein
MSYSFEENLIKLLPEKFHNIQRLVEYLEGCGELLDDLVLLIENLKQLTDINTVPEDFIQLLGNLLNYQSYGKVDQTVDEKRRQVRQIVEWYKIKGTYESFEVLLYSLGLTATIKDLWTNDYITFITGITDESDGYLQFDSGLYLDTGLTLTQFYKSPHFNLEVDFTSDKGGYLFSRKEDSITRDKLEFIRPAHTVPNHSHILNILTDETETANTQVNNVSALVTNNWVDSIKKLDDGLLLDDSHTFDFTSNDMFNDITKFSIGDGNRVKNGFLELWSSGDTSAPDEWVLNGSGVAIRKDTTNKVIGRFSSEFTLIDNFSDVYLYQDYPTYITLLGETVLIQFRTKTSITNQIRLVVDDGVGTSISPYNSGSGDWEVISLSHTLDVAATQLRIKVEINNSGIVNLDQVRLFQNSISPIPPPNDLTSLDNLVFTTTVTSKRALSDRFEFSCIIPTGSVYEDLSEIGLFDTSLTTIYAVGVFPDLYKASDSKIELLVTIYKEPL